MNPDDLNMKVVLYSNRAQCQINLKNYRDAEKDSLSALRLDRKHLKSLFRHGTALYYLKRYKEAKREFSNLIRLDPKNKNGVEYLRHTEQKLSKIKHEAYEKLYFGEIVGDTTGYGNGIIRVEEINLDPKIRKEIEEQKAKVEQNHANTNNSKIQSPNIPEEKQEISGRESKNELLSKTELGNITRQKEDSKDASAFVESAAEEEELRKLEEERKKSKGKKRRKRNQRNKDMNKQEQKEEDKQPPTESPPKLSFQAEEPEPTGPPKLSFGFGDSEEVEGEEMDSPTQGQGTPENFDLMKEALRKEIVSLRKSSDDEVNMGTSLGLGKTGLDFAHGHEIHLEKDTSTGLEKIRQECEEVKKKIPFNEEDEHLDVVKSEEGKFYSVKCSKPPKIKSIFKSRSTNVPIDDTASDRSNVTFDFNNNEIRDFKRNERVVWDVSRTNQTFRSMKQKNKEPKKPKGKGKNRKNQGKSKEEKMAKAERKRKEREEAEEIAENEDEEGESGKEESGFKGMSFEDIEDLDVDDDFSDDNDEEMEQ